ncbi:MAG: hypothetical protein ACD_54C00806G0001 [uncultured bacterium]|nr:MAG: hypothetical protein ACD_54C00806G0001 [uncultured bacterium]
MRQKFEVFQIEPFQNNDLRPRQQSGVQLEAGVFGGGPNQKDGAVFHIGQEAILLGLVETVDFIDEQQGSLPVLPPDFSGFEDLAQVWNAGENRGNLHESQIRFMCQQPGDRGLANAGRSPQDQRRQAVRRQHRPQRTLRAKHMRLADDLRQGARA